MARISQLLAAVRCAAWACIVVVALPLAATAAEELTLLDGKKVSATVTAIDAATGGITAAELTAPLEVQSLRKLQRPAKETSRPATALELHLQGGGSILAETAKIGDERATFRWAYGEGALPLEALRAIQFAAAEKVEGRPTASDQGREAFAAALAKPPADKDSLLVVVEDKVQTLVGLVSEWQAGGVAFDWEGETRQIPYARVYGIVLAQLGAPHDPTGESTVATTDGSTATGRIAGLTDGKLTLLLHGEGESAAAASIPWDAVQSIAVKSDRLVYLSDLKPVDVQVRSIVAIARPWQADRGVLGGPLTIGGQTYEKGLGVAARTELTFQQGAAFDAFAATIGLDASSQGRGNCTFVVRADGKEVFRRAVDGKSAPQEIRVETKGASRVTLVVEPGEDLDLSDHADWCDARFLKAGT